MILKASLAVVCSHAVPIIALNSFNDFKITQTYHRAIIKWLFLPGPNVNQWPIGVFEIHHDKKMSFIAIGTRIPPLLYFYAIDIRVSTVSNKFYIIKNNPYESIPFKNLTQI